MVKGVNRQVLELSTPPEAYFERVLFFVKPEYSAASEQALNERAKYIAQSAGLPPAQRLKKDRRRIVWTAVGSAVGGMVLGALMMVFVITQ